MKRGKKSITGKQQKSGGNKRKKEKEKKKILENIKIWGEDEGKNEK